MSRTALPLLPKMDGAPIIAECLRRPVVTSRWENSTCCVGPDRKHSSASCVSLAFRLIPPSGPHASCPCLHLRQVWNSGLPCCKSPLPIVEVVCLLPSKSPVELCSPAGGGAGGLNIRPQPVFASPAHDKRCELLQPEPVVAKRRIHELVAVSGCRRHGDHRRRLRDRGACRGRVRSNGQG